VGPLKGCIQYIHPGPNIRTDNDMSRVTKCPKCERRLVQCGEITEGRATYPTFQCDECIAVVQLFGEPAEIPLTFWLDEKGTVQYPPTEV
jgi:hypothetical protein